MPIFLRAAGSRSRSNATNRREHTDKGTGRIIILYVHTSNDAQIPWDDEVFPNMASKKYSIRIERLSVVNNIAQLVLCQRTRDCTS